MNTVSWMKQLMVVAVVVGWGFNGHAIQRTNTVSAAVDTRDYVFVVESAYGSPVPPVGTNVFSWRSAVLFGNDNYDLVSERTNHNNLGWLGTGSVTDGAGWIGGPVTLTSLVSTVSWLWDNEYLVQAAASGLGSVWPEGMWLREGEQGVFYSVAEEGWLLIGWSGDGAAGPDTTNLAVTASYAMNVTATFSDDADGDGLKNVDEWSCGANPWMRDTDGDLFDDKAEFDNGGDPTHNDAWRTDYIRANSDRFDLYPSNAVLDVGVGQVGLRIENNRAQIALQLQSSGDLQAWTNIGEAVSWELPVTGDKRFLRVRTTP